MQTTSSQPRAIYYVVALQIWEYFSFYGMRALLILYLTNQLKYDDNHAYALFSAYCSLVYVTPILGGYLADKLLGNRGTAPFHEQRADSRLVKNDFPKEKK